MQEIIGETAKFALFTCNPLLGLILPGFSIGRKGCGQGSWGKNEFPSSHDKKI